MESESRSLSGPDNQGSVLTIKDRLAFGEADTKHRTKDQINAPWRDLPGLSAVEKVIDARTGEVGWRIIPAEVCRD